MVQTMKDRARHVTVLVFILLFGAAGVVFLLTSRAQPASRPVSPMISASCDPGVNAAEYWLFSSTMYSVLRASQQSALRQSVKAADLLYGVDDGSANANPVDGSQTVGIYTSYATFANDVAHDTLQPNVHWVMYDNERWNATPDDEQQQPLLYEQEFASLAHRHGYKVILAPAQGLLPGFNQTAFLDGTSYMQAFVSYFAPVTAKFADIWVIQAQPYELTTYQTSNGYYNLIANAAAAAHVANPHLNLFAGLGPSQASSSSDLYHDWDATRTLVSGYWLTSPQNLSPDQTALAAQFLRQLPAYAGSRGKACAAHA